MKKAVIVFLILVMPHVVFATWGDLNNDRKVSLEDAVYALQSVSGIAASTATLNNAVYALQIAAGMNPNPLNIAEKAVFAKEWLAGRVFYNVTWDYDTSEFVIYTFRFDSTLQKLYFKAGIETPTIENESSYSVLSDGVLKFAPAGYPTQYLAVISFTQDWIQLCWRDNLDELREELEDADDEEFFFLDQTKAMEFVSQ